MSKRLVLLFLTMLFSACTVKPTIPPTNPVDTVEAEEQAVYAFLLPEMYHSRGYVLMDTTTTTIGGMENTPQTLAYAMQNLHDVASETVNSFEQRNEAAYPIRPDMNLGLAYSLLSQAERDTIFGQNQSGWEVFYNRYPQAPGITTLSRVGFNANFDQALVYIGTQSNWLAGAGYYILLKKMNGAWRIDQRVMVWIS